MNNFTHKLRALALGSMAALCCAVPAMADDSEIYLSGTPTVGAKPNVLLIVDNSGSMGDRDASGERVEYNPNTSYATSGNCTAGRIFYRLKGEAQPDCTSTNYITTTANHCLQLTNAVAVGASGGRSGRWTGKTARYDTGTTAWANLVGNGSTDVVECFADNGVHGSNTSSTPDTYARNGSAATKWSSLPSNAIDWSQRSTYHFYAANWLNWFRVTPADRTVSRAQAVENAVVNLMSSVDDVNMGLMRFNLGDATPPASEPANSAEFRYAGGVVINRIQDVNANRASIIGTMTNNTAAGYSAVSLTMLSETLYEAYRYWSGQSMVFGNTVGRDAAATSGSNYISPIASSCTNNYQIILTDGKPTWDLQAEGAIRGLIGGDCDLPDPGQPGLAPPWGFVGNAVARDGRCLDDLAGYMNNPNTDLAPSASIPGNQRVITYTIGMGGDVAGATFLDEVAAEGGGRRFDASNSSDLLDIFDEITNDIYEHVGTSFSTASVSVNAFNRTSSRDELYFALFTPEEQSRWDGNLKKYKYAVVDPDLTGPLPPQIIIRGQGPVASVIDPATGFFTTTSRSYWSDADDGNNVGAGGVVNKLPAYDARMMYTFLGTNPAGTVQALLPITDATVTAAMLGAANATERTAVLDFVRARTAARIGDPMHSVPQVVTYGGTAAAPIDVAYVATNDGFLHAINTADSSGEELWSFVPSELLSRLKPLMDNNIGAHTYGLDGDVRIMRYDINTDGVIDAAAGDRVYLYVGMRRGGQHYYALDVTNRNSPRMLFKLGPSDLPGLGETWSPPVLGRVFVNGASQNGQKFVLVFGGGYNAGQEGYTQVNDGTGNRIFMVDAKSGALLWFAGSTAVATTPNTTPNLVVPGMTNAITGKVTLLDTNGDGYSDRMYAADLGGRIFRFDITNRNPASSLVAGGVFAALGQGLAAGGSVGTPNIADTRRFYNGPDVALFESRGSSSYMSISIGSGYRGHPLHRATTDRFYVLRDKNPFQSMTQAQYNAFTPITHASANLRDITSNPVGANLVPADLGWFYSFSANAGEKVLAEATTAGGTVMFTTYQPLDPDPAFPCRSQHRNRAYAFNAGSGRPALDLNNDGVITNADMLEMINHAGILGGINISVLRGDLLAQYNEACRQSGPNACADNNGQSRLVCQAGMHIMGRCVPFGDGGRNFWRRKADSGVSP